MDILVQILKAHVDHHQHGDAVRRLGHYLVEKEADKNFYVVLIRFFDAGNVLFHQSYQPPKKQKVHKKETAEETEKVMELYSKAMAGMPTLHGGSSRKTRLNLFSSLGQPKPLLSKTERLQSELHQKQRKLESLTVNDFASGENEAAKQ